MNHINPNKIGMALGAFAGLAHLVWSVAVAMGLAQVWIDFIFRLHMVESQFQVSEFSLGTSVTLVIVTTIMGYVVGWVLGNIWNWVQRN
jgi:heme/copper-type cytochrome/quinol oxidase subunit 4